jgi:hypothetical protein
VAARQSYFLNAAGIGLVHDVGGDIHGTKIDLLFAKDATIGRTLKARYGDMSIRVFRRGDSPSICWRLWTEGGAVPGTTAKQQGPLHWTRVALQSTVPPYKVLSWTWQVDVLYGNVCVDTDVGPSRTLPRSWFPHERRDVEAALMSANATRPAAQYAAQKARHLMIRHARPEPRSSASQTLDTGTFAPFGLAGWGWGRAGAYP